MRIIPVIDLLGGRAVHAVRGERCRYRPVKGVLGDAADPRALARAFRDELGTEELYVADLDAIRSGTPRVHRETIKALIRDGNTRIILDAGVSAPDAVQEWVDLGIRAVIVGSETLEGADALERLPGGLDPRRLIFSLDLKSGRVLSRCPELAGTEPMEIMRRLATAGWREVIILDLARVGTGGGAAWTLAAAARNLCPDLKLLIGGGVADPEELARMSERGIDGILLATALHRGVIRAEHLRRFGQ